MKVERITFEQIMVNRYRAYARTWIALGCPHEAEVRIQMAERWEALYVENWGK